MESLVTLASYANPVEAHIIRGLLESRGIESFVFDELSAAYTPMVVAVRLMVRRSDLERALEILGEEKQ